MALPGLPGFPPLNLNVASSASAALEQQGSAWGFGGDWTVQIAGSGVSAQGASGTAAPPLWLMLAAVGVAWLLSK